jgi:zinc transport system permease protein
MDIFVQMFSYDFLLRAILVGVIVSACCAMLGTNLVLKRFSMIGDGLSHVGFGALAIALACNVAPLAVAIPVVVIAAVLLLRINQNSKIKGDSAIALIATGSMAVGVMIISLTNGMTTDIYSYMYGSILAISKSDLKISIVLSIAVILLFVFFYNTLCAVTFDENFAKAIGINTGFYNTVIAILTAITIVLGMKLVGTLLISSLIVIPTLASTRICRHFRTVVICSVLFEIVCFFIGIFISFAFTTPAGASVVCVNIAILLIIIGFDKIRTMVRKRNL